MKDNKPVKKINLFDCIVMGIGSIIGAGIFAVAPIGMRMVGNSIVIAFLLAAVFVFLKTIPEIIISSSLPANGGAYMHLSRLLHPSLAVLQAFNQLVIGTMKVATLALTFGEYFAMLVPQIPTWLVASLIALIFTIISLFGIKTSAIVQNISVAVLLVAMFMYIVMGWGSTAIGIAELVSINIRLVQIWAVMGMLHGSLIGANVLMYAADEIENPRKTIPVAFTVSTIICTVIYALICFVAIGNQQPPITSVGAPDFATPYNFATIGANFMGSGTLAFFITGGALLAVVTSINAVILMFSRSHFVAARDGLFPNVIAKVNKHGVPSASIWLNSIIGILAIVSGYNLDDVVKITSLPGLLLSPLLFLAIFVLPKKYPNAYKNCLIRFPHWLNCTLVVVAAVLSFLLGGSVLSSMAPKNWITMIVFYALAVVYTIVRKMWLKKKKGVDLFATMRGRYQPWDELEASLAAERAGPPDAGMPVTEAKLPTGGDDEEK